MEVERVWHRRLRWRLRGAWQWPAFIGLTLLDGVVLTVLPPYEGGPPNVFPGVLLAAFVNLLAVAVVAPLLGLVLRRRRPDLPRFIASDYAGTWLLLAITAAFVVGGLAHRSEAQAESARENAVARAMHDYVVSSAREYAAGLNHDRRRQARARSLPHVHSGAGRTPRAVPVRRDRPAPAGRDPRHLRGAELDLPPPAGVISAGRANCGI